MIDEYVIFLESLLLQTTGGYSTNQTVRGKDFKPNFASRPSPVRPPPPSRKRPIVATVQKARVDLYNQKKHAYRRELKPKHMQEFKAFPVFPPFPNGVKKATTRLEQG